MARKTGVTRETVKRLVLDAGVVYLNFGSTDPQKPQTKLGACRGGSTFNVDTTWRDMPFDGVGGFVKGARRALSVEVNLTVNLVEITKDLLKIAVPGADYSGPTPAQDIDGVTITGENRYEIKRIMEKTIPDFDYQDVAIVAEYSGTRTEVVCGIKNGMANTGLELNFADEDEAVMTITFTGAFDPENMAEEPWFIIVPEKATTGTTQQSAGISYSGTGDDL